MTFSSVKMFRDIPKLIQKCVRNRTPLTEGMRLWLDYCEHQYPAKVWAGLRKLDYETDFDGLTLWLADLLQSEPPPRTINGLWFGLYNPILKDGQPTCELYLAGSERFDKPDWQCSPEYWPEGRYAPSDVLTAIYRRCESGKGAVDILGEAFLCQGYVALVLARWCRGPMRSRLLGEAKSRGIGLGHDSGDAYVVEVLK